VHPTGRYYYNSMIEILEANMSAESSEAHGDISLNPDNGGIYLVNRLDRLTSGIVLVARTIERTQIMANQFSERLVGKSYLCRCVGEFPEGEIVCREPILNFSFMPSVSCVSDEGKPCVTRFERVSYNGSTSVVKCSPETGRTHQVREFDSIDG
jgi:23S rRNA-/tRNA-specific pseudouridylate synthase